MDGDSVRSGRSEKSDRSRRSKRTQRLSNASSTQPSYMYQGQLKNGSNIQNAPLPNQPLMIDQNMQLSDANVHPSFHNQIMPNIQQGHMNVFPPQPLGYPQQQQQQPNSHLYNMESWISPNIQMNSNCSQPNIYSSHPQNWIGQPIQQAYTQFVPPPMTNQFVRSPMNLTPLNPVQLQHQQQQQVEQFITPGQHPLVNSATQNLTNSHLPNCQMPLEQPTQLSNAYRPERFDTRDENAWVEEVTAVTGATSETGLSGGDNFSRFGARYGLAASLGIHGNGAGFGLSGAAAALIRSETDDIKFFKCSHIMSMLISVFLGVSSLLSPILMLILPAFPFWIGWSTNTCESDCEGHLISISVKLILLAIALWFLGSPCRPFCSGDGATVILPRIRLCRTLFLCLILVILFAFWLFYTVRVIQPKESNYYSIVQFASSLTDTLLFLHYAGIALMELRRIRFQYAVHVVRSPDGASKTFKCGDMSLQRVALEVLQFYMVEFTTYNPNQNQLTSVGNVGKRSRRGGGGGSAVGGGNNGGGSKYKFYDVDGGNSGLGKGHDSSVVTYTVDQPAIPGTTLSASARLYEEIELEKRIRKRRMRLLLAVEEAFTHVKRLTNGNGNLLVDCNQTGMPFDNCKINGRLSKLTCTSGKSLDPYEAAQAVFPTLIRPLQKYMRVTRQQARHPVDMVIDHLALCLAYGLSPLAFLERFNLLVATPQQDAAAAASVIHSAKRAKKNLKQQQQQLQQQQQPQQKQGKTSAQTETDSSSNLIPKRIYPGGQQVWRIVADRALSRSLTDGIVFQLRRGNDISLLCTIRRLPLILLIDEILEPMDAGRFVLRTDNAV